MEIIIALAQYPITPHENFAGWKAHTTRWVEEAVKDRKPHLLVFPEYGSMEMTSFLPEEIRADLQKQLFVLQEFQPYFCNTFRKLAQQHQIVIVAPSFPVLLINNQTFVNRAFVFGPNGEGFQDKQFMTRFENEEWGISAGDSQLTIFEAEWGSFGVQICYDIEFPIGSHRLAKAGAGLIVAPSCTETIRGATRVHIGARARAMEQQIYTAVAQTINEARWSPAVDVNYGYAAVYSSPDKGLPEEGIIASGIPEKPEWLVTSVDTEKNEAIRRDGQVLNYTDMQQLTMERNEPVHVAVVKV